MDDTRPDAVPYFRSHVALVCVSEAQVRLPPTHCLGTRLRSGVELAAATDLGRHGSRMGFEAEM